MAGLDQIEPFDVNFINGNQLARQNALADQQQALYANAGNLYADGDRTGAVNALYRGGDFGQANNLTNMNVADQNRALGKTAGGLAANGDMSGARDAYFKGGDLDSAKTVQNFMNSASDRDLAAATRAHAVTSGLAQAADTQDKWGLALNAARSSGLDTSKYDQIGQQYGWQAARNMALADHGDMGTALTQESDKRTQAKTTLGQAALLGPDKWDALYSAMVKAGTAPTGYDGEQGRQMALAQAGLGSKVFDADAKTEAAASRATRQSALQQATQNVITGAKTRYPDFQGDIPLDLAQAAAASRGRLTYNDGQWAIENPDGSVSDLRGKAISNQGKRYDPTVTAQNAYAREGAKSNVKLDTQLNRLASVQDQIQQLKNMAGEEGSPERDTFNHSIGYLTSHSGKQYWMGTLPFTESSKVPATMFNLRSRVHTLQDELAQYVQSGSGQGSDVRAKNAYEIVGDLQNSPDVPTFLSRLDSIDSTVGSIRKTPHVNPLASGVNGQANGEGNPSLTIPPRPGVLPPNSQYSPSRNQWRDPSGKIYDAQGNPVQ